MDALGKHFGEFRLILPPKYEVLAGLDFSCFFFGHAKVMNKSITSGYFGSLGWDFLDFCRFFGTAFFDGFLAGF